MAPHRSIVFCGQGRVLQVGTDSDSIASSCPHRSRRRKCYPFGRSHHLKIINTITLISKLQYYKNILHSFTENPRYEKFLSFLN